MRLFYFLLISYALNAQNLVPNPSFELHTTCPFTIGTLSSVAQWYNVPGHLGSPDYFNACSSDVLGIPNNSFGTQEAFDGSAYAGLCTYDSFTAIREYIETELVAPLIAGQTYLVSFYVSCAEKSEYGANNLGVRFTIDNIAFDGPVDGALNLTPHVFNPAPITNQIGWTLISGTYLASGNERFITIGNFNNNALTQAVPTNAPSPTFTVAYYYIDQVSVVALPLENNVFLENKFQIAPNPIDKEFTMVSNQSETITDIELYSQYTRVRIFKTESIVHDIHDLPSGIYYLVVTSESGKKYTHKIIKS